MKKYAGILLLSLGLGGCYSSGGGGGSVSVPTTPVASNTSTASLPEMPVANTGNDFLTSMGKAFQNSTSQQLTGAIYTPSSKQVQNPAQNDDLEMLYINGVKIKLLGAYDFLNGTATAKLKALSNNDVQEGQVGTLSGYVGSVADKEGNFGEYQDPNSFKAMRYGVVTIDGVSSPFVQGFLTPLQTENVRGETYYSMPSEHTFKYKGFAVYGKDNAYQQLKSEVIADFTHKKVKVELFDGNQSKAVFGGDINGNTFSGERNQISTKGAFYGSKARDVGGIFEDKATGYNGAFGASESRSDSTDLSQF